MNSCKLDPEAAYSARRIIERHKYIKKTIALEQTYFDSLYDTFNTTLGALKTHQTLLTDDLADTFTKINRLIDEVKTELETIDHGILKKVQAPTDAEKQRLKTYDEVFAAIELIDVEEGAMDL